MNQKTEEAGIDFREALGATTEVSVQQLTLFIPNKNRHDQEVRDQRQWVVEAAQLLAKIGGGFTILPPLEGGWVNESGEVIWENPVIIYTYVKPKPFLAILPELKSFLCRLGRETDQGEVALVFDGNFYRITSFGGD